MTDEQIIDWLMVGDPAIAYQCINDLKGGKPKQLKKVDNSAWLSRFLNAANADGTWGRAYYQPKWISTHYTLFDIRLLEPNPQIPLVQNTILRTIDQEKGTDGGINPSGISVSDVCINGMFLNIASYFSTPENKLKSIVDYIISQNMNDGGFNCRYNRSGAKHSSMHSTISVLEGIRTYLKNGYSYRSESFEKIEKQSREFLLMHRLFKSDHTGETIHPDFLKFRFPFRWKYDILRALDYFRMAESDLDERLNDAIQIVKDKRGKNGLWKLPAALPGQTHFAMEKAGQDSRWNTLRALRVLKYFDNL